MSTQKEGGPAFPEGESWIVTRSGLKDELCSRSPLRPGMSLRDWFAGQALIGLLAAEAHPQSPGVLPLSLEQAGTYTQAAYRLADAMLAERHK